MTAASSPVSEGASERPLAARQEAFAHGARANLILIAVCALIAAGSLHWGWSVTADAWNWLRWAREMSHFTLDTTGTWTSWKPLPSLLMAPLSAVTEHTPTIWMIVSRASGLAAVAIGFRLTTALVVSALPDVDSRSRAAGWVAGSAAAVAILRLVFGESLQGFSEPVVLALTLAALERALAGQSRSALLIGWASCLVRPDQGLVMVAYSAWLWRREPGLRALIVGLPAAVAVAWIVPDWIGSGLFGNSPALLAEYVVRVDRLPGYDRGAVGMLGLAFRSLPWPAWAFAALGLGFAAVQLARRNPLPALTAAAGITCLAVPVLQVLVGAPSTSRYTRTGVALLMVIGGFGLGYLIRLACERWQPDSRAATVTRALAPLAGLAAVAALAASTGPRARYIWTYFQQRAVGVGQLERAIEKAGGPAAIRSCLPIARQGRTDGLLAWQLNLGMDAFSDRGAPGDPKLAKPFPRGTTFREGSRASHPPDMLSPDVIAPGARIVASDGRWTIWQNC